jgi:NADH dehydrogenase
MSVRSPAGPVLQVGATGNLGSRIADRLLAHDVDLRVLVREGTSADELVQRGAEPVEGDLREPASLERAVDGVEAVVTTANAPGGRDADTIEEVDLEGNAALVDRAEAAGVEQFVYTSAWLAEEDDPNPFFRAKALTEQRLREADLAETILAPNIFMESSVPGIVIEPALERGTVTLVGEGRRKHTWVSIEDVAELAANVLGREAAFGQRLRFGGPEAVTWREVVDLAADALDTDVELAFVEPGEPVPGLSDFQAGVLAGSEEFDSDVDTAEVAETFDVERTTIEAFLEGWVEDDVAEPG